MAKYNQLTVNVLTPTAFEVGKTPPASAYKGSIIYVSNGNVGQPTLAFSDGTNWKVLTIGSTIS